MKVIYDLFNDLMAGPSEQPNVVEEFLTQRHTILEIFICLHQVAPVILEFHVPALLFLVLPPLMQVLRSLLILLDLPHHFSNTFFRFLIECEVTIIIFIRAGTRTVLIPHISVVVKLHIVDVEILLKYQIQVRIVAI
jgi:hypothetical protein